MEMPASRLFEDISHRKTFKTDNILFEECPKMHFNNSKIIHSLFEKNMNSRKT